MEKKYIAIGMVIIGLLLTLFGVMSVFQLRMMPLSVAYQKGGPRISWERTEGPGTFTNLLSTVTPGEKIRFCGKVRVDSNSPRPIYEGKLVFEAYAKPPRELASDPIKEDVPCYIAQVMCKSMLDPRVNEACPSEACIKAKEISVGRINPGEESDEYCFEINPQTEGLELDKKYVTILYIWDDSYVLEECHFKPGSVPTLAVDWWIWNYSKVPPIVEIIKKAPIVIGPIMSLAGLALLFKKW